VRRIEMTKACFLLCGGLLGVAAFEFQFDLASEGKSNVTVEMPNESSLQSLEHVEFDSPEVELKTERGKILSGMEASF
jgi:hypothetical protein